MHYDEPASDPEMQPQYNHDTDLEPDEPVDSNDNTPNAPNGHDHENDEVSIVNDEDDANDDKDDVTVDIPNHNDGIADFDAHNGNDNNTISEDRCN